MFVILVNSDNTLMPSKRERIMQRENLVNKLWILVAPEYNGYDMSKFTVMLEYVLPCSKVYRTEILELSDEMYEGHLKYTLPFSTMLTSESGEIEVQLTFANVDLDENGNDIQQVRKTSSCKIVITPISKWADIVPDKALSGLDQRLIITNAQIKALNDLANTLETNQVDNLEYNSLDDTLQLTSNGNIVGDKVLVKEILENRVPVVGDDDVVEF